MARLRQFPKALIVIDHYLPGTRSGGPVRSISNLVESLGDDIEFVILTRDRDIGDRQPYPSVSARSWIRVGKAMVSYLDSRARMPWRVARIVKQVNPDVVVLNGMFPSLVLSCLIARRFHLFRQYAVVVAPRGHLERGALSLKSRKKRLFLALAKVLKLYRDVYWLCASEMEQQDVIREFGMQNRSRTAVISNPTMTASAMCYEDVAPKQKGMLRLVFLSRISRKKNLVFALESLADIVDPVQFDIYGPVEDEGYWTACSEVIDHLPQCVTVSYKAAVDHEQVGSVLARYDLFIMPTLGENFGHVILEALSAGCPVLISDRTPWNDVNEHGAGWALPLDQPEKFREVIQMLVDADDETMSRYRQNARNYAADYLAKSTAVEDMRKFLLEVAASGRKT